MTGNNIKNASDLLINKMKKRTLDNVQKLNEVEKTIDF